MTEVVVTSNEIISILVLLGILGLIATFLYKLYNVLNGGEICDLAMTIVILAIGSFAYIFVEVGIFINMTHDIDAILIEYNVYFMLARPLMALIWILWFVELFLNTTKVTVDPLKRMSKRRNERVNSYRNS